MRYRLRQYRVHHGLTAVGKRLGRMKMALFGRKTFYPMIFQRHEFDIWLQCGYRTCFRTGFN